MIKQRAKKDIKRRVKILVTCLICIIVIIQIQNENQQVSAKQESANTQETEQIQEETTEELAKENTEQVEEVVEPTEDEEIKNLITEIKTQNNLTEENFAFFYYNPQTQKYYFDNQSKYFKAASTVKVPVAIMYYDKIKNGELTKESTLQYTSDDYEEGGGTTASLYSVGDNVPISYLLEQSIVNSDNTAVNILIDGIGYRKCREQIAEFSDEQFTEEFYTTNLTTADEGYNIITVSYTHLKRSYIKYQNTRKYKYKHSNSRRTRHLTWNRSINCS